MCGARQGKKGPNGDVSKLLNRLLGVPVKLQGNIFAFFMALQDAEIREAKRLGTFDQSAISTPAGVLRLLREDVVLRDRASGLETCIVHLEIDRVCHLCDRAHCCAILGGAVRSLAPFRPPFSSDLRSQTHGGSMSVVPCLGCSCELNPFCLCTHASLRQAGTRVSRRSDQTLLACRA